VLSLLIVRSIIIIILILLTISQIGIKIPDFSRIKEFLVYGMPLVPAGFFAWFIDVGDRYVIGFFMDIASVGVYSAAYSLCNILFMFSSMISFVLFPTISKLWHEKDRIGAFR